MNLALPVWSSALLALLAPLDVPTGAVAFPRGAGVEAAEDPHDELVPPKPRKKLLGLVDDLCRLGEQEEVATLRSVLLELGDDPEDHAKRERAWGRDLERAKNRDKERAWTTFRRDLESVLTELAGVLATLEPERRERLAELLLELDGELAPAHEALGRTRLGGAWLSPEALANHEADARVTELVQLASALEIDIQHGPSTLAAARALYGDEARFVAAKGIELHGGMEAHKLERALRQALRAIALSAGILDGAFSWPELPITYRFFVVASDEDYDRALEEANDSGGLFPGAYQDQRALRMLGLSDRRGWRTVRWCTEARLSTVVLFDLSYFFLGAEAQPCFVAGHLNWLSLRMLGAALPAIRWSEAQEVADRSSSERGWNPKAVWRSASRTLFGCREWMVRSLREGREIPFARAIVPEVGMITDEFLLKATLVNEYLQARGEMRSLLVETHGKVEDRASAVEEALGRSLPELESEWTRWMLGEERPQGLLQRLFAGVADTTDPAAAKVLSQLRAVRNEAFRDLRLWHDELYLSEELSRHALGHARYLATHEEQLSAWPDAHEEFPDREGFSPEGAWAGNHSVIHPGHLPDAIDAWMGTFYHRLPLLDPGLFGIGVGSHAGINVLDSGSLVAPPLGEGWVLWPARDATGVPRRFVPELPNPIPGADQSLFGYPITLQVYQSLEAEDLDLTMRLFRGKDTQGAPVPCTYLTPSTPLFQELVPPNAYCLIPDAHLAAGETYTVQARCARTGEEQVWSFRTAP